MPREAFHEVFGGLFVPSPMPRPTVERVCLYLSTLQRMADEGVTVVQAQDLADAAGANALQVRKDLSFLNSLHLGSFGTPGVGYAVKNLLYVLSNYAGLTRERAVAVVGFGRVGAALGHYPGFAERNFRIAAIFDRDPSKIGQMAGETAVWPLSELEPVVRKEGIDIAIIATPAAEAQTVADLLVAAGVKALLNFAPVHLKVPDDVVVRQVDLANELQVLAFFAAHRPQHARGEEPL